MICTYICICMLSQDPIMDLPEAIPAAIPTPAPVPPSSQAPHVTPPPMHSSCVRRALRAFQDYVPNVRANDTLHESLVHLAPIPEEPEPVPVMRPLTSRFPFLSFRRQTRGSERPLTRHHASGLKSAQDPVDSTCYQGRIFYGPSLPLATSAPKHCLEGLPLPCTQVTLLKPLSRTARHSTRNS